MAKIKNQSIIDLASEIEDFSKSIAKEMAIKSREDLYKAANNAITKFYNHYTPDYYKRHIIPYYQHNINKGIKKYYHSPHGNIYSGGIELSPESMDDLYKIREDYIFNLILAGFHGNIPMLPQYGKDGTPISRNIPPIMSPSPLELILDERDRLIKSVSKDANDVAQKVKKEKGYKYIS